MIKKLRSTGALLVCSAILLYPGLASIAFGGDPCNDKPKKPCGICDKLFPNKNKPCGKPVAQAPYNDPCPKAGDATAALPPHAEPGECYAKTVIPAEYKTVTERRMTREASTQLEASPATFKWVEEKVLLKEASTRLEVVPAEYTWQEKTIEVKPAHTGWVMQTAVDCVAPDNKTVLGGVVCLRTTPAEFKTIRTQCLVRPASTRTVSIPAEYQTVRRQVVDTPAMTRTINIPAEYENVDKVVLVCPESVKWEHVVCEDKLTADTVNKVKTSLLASGYKPGPLNGTLTQEDRLALAQYQMKNRLGVGYLSYETLKRLGVSVQ